MPRKLNLLIADDDEAFKILIQNCMLDSPDLHEKCELRYVADGTDAVDYVLGRGAFADRLLFPEPDMVILDERMIQMDGREALERIRKADAGSFIPICMFSTSAQNKWRHQCYRTGAVFCVKKPLEYEALSEKIRLMIEFFTTVMELPTEQPYSIGL